jgi:Tol biopolymer transport system component
LHPLVADNHVSEARWSPNGRKMVVLHQVPLQYDSTSTGIPNWANQIYVVNSDGTGLQRIDGGVATAPTAPAWSPDSNSIAFLSGKTVYIVNADGSHQRHFPYDTAHDINTEKEGCMVGQIPPNGPDAYGLSWEPDGKRLALQTFFCGHAQYVTYLVNLDGSNLHQAFQFWDYLAWSPVQNRLITSSGWSPWIVVQDIDDKGVAKPVRNTSPSPTLNPDDPQYTGPYSCYGGSGSWSRDGRWIACASAGVDIINANGDYQFTLVSGFIWNTAKTDLAPISWSPDGQQIALLKEGESPDYGYGVLYVINTDGSNLHPLVAGVLPPAVMWQPPVK